MLLNIILSTEIIAFWQIKTLLWKTQDPSAKPYSYYIVIHHCMLLYLVVS